MVNSPNCLLCLTVQDNVHLFSECVMVREAWFWIRQRLLQMHPGSGITSNFEFLHLMFEKGLMDEEMTWIRGIFVHFVWDIVICKKKHLKLETVKSEIHLKYLSHKHYNKPSLAYIVGLLD